MSSSARFVLLVALALASAALFVSTQPPRAGHASRRSAPFATTPRGRELASADRARSAIPDRRARETGARVVPDSDSAAARAEAMRERLREQGGANLQDAVALARSQSDLPLPTAIEEVFRGAADNPAGVISTARELEHALPQLADDIRPAAVRALTATAHYAAAADYASKSPPDTRRSLVEAAYATWARHAPEQAIADALSLPDVSAQRSATASVFAGWSAVDPRAVASTALEFPDGPEKSTALTTALHAWFARDPGSAETWIRTHPSPAVAVAAERALDD